MGDVGPTVAQDGSAAAMAGPKELQRGRADLLEASFAGYTVRYTRCHSSQP